MEILIILFLLLINGVFAMAEIAIVSARKTRLAQWADEGNARAQTALELANAPNRFLSTVQVGITLVGILAGAFGGATVARSLADILRNIPILAPHSEALALAIVVIVTTYLSLVIGELVPKRVALHDPERIATLVAAPMRLLAAATFPLVHLLSLSTEAVLRLLGVRHRRDSVVTEEEILTLIQQGIQAGVFEPTEPEMVSGVFKLDEQRISALMTPRTEIVWLDVEHSADEIRQTLSAHHHTYYPVCRRQIDNILGVVDTKALLNQCLSGQPLNLESVLQRPIFIPETASASQALQRLKAAGGHLALVIDEYGELEGLVTINDVMEEIVGDIDLEEPKAVQRPDGSWLLDGLLPIDELADILPDIRLPPDERGHYQTLAGFVLARLERIPRTAEGFEWSGYDFEIVDMDGRRIDKVLVRPAPTADIVPPDTEGEP